MKFANKHFDIKNVMIKIPKNFLREAVESGTESLVIICIFSGNIISPCFEDLQ